MLTLRNKLPISLLLFLTLLSGCSTPADQRPLPDSYGVTAKPGYQLIMGKVHNFRDLGGYQTIDGQQIKWGMLYRSSSLSELNSQDLDYLHRLNIKLVYDFRSQEEKDQAPDNLPDSSAIRYIDMPINPGGNTFSVVKQEMKKANQNSAGLHGYMVQLNRDLISDFTPSYKDWFHQLLEQQGTPLVFHCTAGKDRTGLAAALLMRTLGVSRNAVMRDYLLSNDYSEEYIASSLFKFHLFTLFRYDDSLLRPLLEVREEYLNAAFDQIDQQYGSFENYLHKGLEISPQSQAQLKHIYLHQANEES